MEKQDITIPLELLDGTFSLDEIATISVLMAAPNLSSESLKIWSENEKCNETTNSLISKGIVSKNDGEVVINLEPPSDLETIIKRILLENSLSTSSDKAVQLILDIIDDIKQLSYADGYEKGYQDGEVDFDVKN
jgi:hypothetical protein